MGQGLFFYFYYGILPWKETKGASIIIPQLQQRRQNAVRVADAMNKIEGVPVTAFARELSTKWANGEISGEQMKTALLAKHKKACHE